MYHSVSGRGAAAAEPSDASAGSPPSRKVPDVNRRDYLKNQLQGSLSKYLPAASGGCRRGRARSAPAAEEPAVNQDAPKRRHHHRRRRRRRYQGATLRRHHHQHRNRPHHCW